jgi:hypothetical protein
MIRDIATAKEMMAEWNEEMLFADGYDNCLLGVLELFGHPPIAVYDKTKVLAEIMRDTELTYEDALEHYEYNMLGSYVGESTPAYLVPMHDIYDDGED